MSRTAMTDDNLARSIRAIRLFQYFISFLLLLVGILPSARFPLAPAARADLTGFAIVTVSGLAGPLFFFLLARHLRRFRPEARTVTLVVSCIGLLGFPIGTILNAVFLFVLIKGKHLFRPEPRLPQASAGGMEENG